MPDSSVSDYIISLGPRERMDEKESPAISAGLFEK